MHMLCWYITPSACLFHRALNATSIDLPADLVVRPCPIWLKPLLLQRPPLIKGIYVWWEYVRCDPWLLGSYTENLASSFRHASVKC